MIDHLGEIAIQRFLVAALNQDFVAVAENQRTETVPLRLEDPLSARGKSSIRLASIGNSGGLTGSCTISCYIVRADLSCLCAGWNDPLGRLRCRIHIT